MDRRAILPSAERVPCPSELPSNPVETRGGLINKKRLAIIAALAMTMGPVGTVVVNGVYPAMREKIDDIRGGQPFDPTDVISSKSMFADVEPEKVK